MSDAMLTPEQIAHELGGAKKAGDQWLARCPGHDDANPSLSIGQRDNKLLFRCHAGCAQNHVMKALRARGLLPDEEPTRINGFAKTNGSTNGAGGHHQKTEGDDWHPILPPPPDAPRPTDKQLQCDMLHEYLDAEDHLLCYVRRINAKDDKRKQFFPLTWGVLNGAKGWHAKAVEAPKPLYGLNRLSHAAPGSTVLLCEGEKSADAAQRLFPDHVGMAWMGGTTCADKADTTPLKGFPVIVWGDADEPGRKAAQAIAARIPAAKILDTKGLSEGFDAADLEDMDVGPAAWLKERTPRSRILAGANFIAHHKPPVWLIDGIVQRSRLYSCTSLTGHGKTAVWLFNACMIHAGRMIGQLDIFQGNVLFLAGENPADLEARVIGMMKAFGIPPDRLPYVLPGCFPLTEGGAEVLQQDIAKCIGKPLALIVGDTASSFFPGDDENDNVQAGHYARTLRRLSECDGKPAIMTLCHPVKNASRSNLQPRGGSAFMNELDGNLTLWSQSRGEVTEMHWQGKIRGPDFSPLGYRLRSVVTGLMDEKGRPETTIVAEPMSEEAIADHNKQSLANEDVVLRALRDHPDWSYNQIAREAAWVGDDGNPEKWRVQRAVSSLADDKLVAQPRKGARWELTDKGKKAAPGGEDVT